MICFESYTGKLTFWEISRVNKELIDNMSSRNSRQLCYVYNTNGVKSYGSLRVLFFFLIFNQIAVLYIRDILKHVVVISVFVVVVVIVYVNMISKMFNIASSTITLTTSYSISSDYYLTSRFVRR